MPLSANTNAAGAAGQTMTVTGVTNSISVSKTGTGTWVLSGANTYTGATAIAASGGTLQLGSGSTGGSLSTSSAISIGASSTFAVNQSDTVTQGTDFSSLPIIGAGGFSQAGSGNTVLNQANTFSGASSVRNGTLTLDGGANRLLSTGTVVLGDTGTTGKLILGGTTTANQTLAGLTTTGLGGSVVGGNASNSTLTLTISGAASTFGGTLGGAGTNENNLALTKAGTHALTLSSANTYTGATTVSTGLLIVTTNGALGSNAAGTTVAAGASLGLSGGIDYATTETISGSGGGAATIGAFVGTRGFIQSASGNNTFRGNIELNANGLSRIGTQDGASLTLTGAITQASGITTANILFRTGSTAGDFVTLSNAGNSFGGDSTVFTGSTTGYAGVRLGINDALPTDLTVSGFATTNATYTALDLAGFNQKLDGLITGGGALQIINTNTGTPSTLTLLPTADTSTTNTLILGGGGLGVISLVKAGTFTQTLSTNNTYTGGTTVNQGTLSINTIKDVSGGSSAIGAPTTVATGLIAMGNVATTGTLLYTGAVQSTDRTIQIGTNSATPAVGDTGGATIEANGASNAALTFSAATFNTQTDATTGVGANRTLTLQGASTGANTISGIIQDNLVSGAGTGTATVALTKAGAGTWVLGGTAANTYTGLTTVTLGELALNKTAAVDAIAGNVTINGGTLKLLASDQIANTSAITMTSGAFNLNGQTETVTSFSNSGGTFTTGAGTLIGTGATVTWSGGTNTINDGGSVQDGHLVISGGTNTVEGGATGGLLQLNSSGAGLEMSNGATLTLNSDNTTAGKLLLKGDVSTSGNSTVTIDSGLALTNKGNIDLDTGTRTFTVANGTAATDLSVSAVITNGALTKAGAGTMALTGASTYTGTTTVSAGTLQLGAGSTTGSLSASSAIVNNGNLTINRSNAVAQGTDFSGADITGTGSFTQAGTGTTTLNVANSYTGGTTVTAGTLALAHNNAAGTAGISITGASAATLQIDVGITLAGNNITFSNTNAASSVKHDVAASGTYTTGTSGNLTSSFAGGQADTTAQILGGTSSLASTLEMLFAGTSAATNDAIRRSDVFTTAGTSTDTYVIQLSTGALAADSVLAWLNGSNEWVHAGTTFYNETYTFASRVVGDYGYDSGNVWAVVNHGGAFAAVPEPTSALAGLLVAAGLLRRRRSA